MTARRALPWVREEAGSYTALDGEATYYVFREYASNWKAVRMDIQGVRTIVARNCPALAMAKRGAEAHAAKQSQGSSRPGGTGPIAPMPGYGPHFADGHWQATPYLMAPTPCPGANVTRGWSLEPQPDDTLRGVGTMTALASECDDQGTVWRTPMVVTRTGDVPPSVTVADPALFMAPTAPATSGHN